MERDTICAVVSLIQDTVIDAKCACNEVEEKESGVLIDIGMQADFRMEFSESGKYAITAYGEPVGEPAFCTVEAKLNDEMLTVFTIVGEEAKKGIGGVSRALEIEKGVYTLSIKSRGGRGGCILEKISVGPAREENPNHYKPSDREEAVEYKDHWPVEATPVFRRIFVSPTGHAWAAGTKEDPFDTLSRAKQEVAKLRPQMTGDIIVSMAPGCYELSETEVFGPEHAGNETCHVIYQGSDPANKPLISGGKRVEGWAPYNEFLWRAPVPDGICHVRNLYVNGNPAVRARSKYTYACDEIYVDPGAEQKLHVQYGERYIEYQRKDGVIVSPRNFPVWISNYEDVEFVWSLIWTRQRTLVKEVKKLEDGRLLFLMDPDSFNTYHDVQGILPNKEADFYIENAFELLDEPGEFYYNRKDGFIYYFPYEQEDMRNAEVFVGNIQKMIHVEGTKEHPVRGLVFDNLDIRYGGWDYVSENGLFTVQADVIMYHENGVHRSRTVPAEIEILHADRVGITNCCIACQGASAMSFTDDVKNAKIIGNRITDCSGAGIKVGSSALPGRKELTICENFAVENNAILRVGGEYAGCTGIICYYISGARIINNTIKHTAYTGISLGWGWGCTDPAGNGGVIVRNNQVVDAMLSLNDGSHIYTLGPLRNSEIAYNYFGSTMEAGGGCGVYFDAGSGFINAHDNVTYVKYRGKSFTASGLHWIHNCRMQHYYSNTRGYEVPGDIRSIDYEPPILKAYGEEWPREAQEIIEGSGVSGAYKELLTQSEQPVWRKDRLDTVPKKPFFTRTIGTWIDAGEFINDENVGWHKHTPQYWQNCCRMFEGVCMEYIPGIRGYVINDTEPGEWVKYRVQVEKTGTWCIDMRATQTCAPEEPWPSVNIYMDDQLVIEHFPIPRTSGLHDLKQLKLGEVTLTEGLHIMKVEICDNSFAFSGFRFHDGSLYEEDAKGIAYDEGVVVRG